MIRLTRRLALAAAFGTMLALTGTLSGCGYNDFQRLDEAVKAGWSEVLNQYQRRADLIPNIVNTVKGEANFEQETLARVVEARSRATAIQATPALINDPQAFNRFQAAQGELTGALSRLLAVTENYPNLKANQGFQDLRVQLEGTENRITVARNRYIKAVAEYNVLARQFPTNLTAKVFSYEVKVDGELNEAGAQALKQAMDQVLSQFGWFTAGLLYAFHGVAQAYENDYEDADVQEVLRQLALRLAD